MLILVTVKFQYKFLRTGGGPPGVLFYHGLLLFFFYLFIKFFLSLNNFFSRSASKIHGDELLLVLQNVNQLPIKKKKCRFSAYFFLFSVKANK